MQMHFIIWQNVLSREVKYVLAAGPTYNRWTILITGNDFILLISMFLNAQAKTTFLKHNAIVKHWWDMQSLQQESAVFQSHYAI